jgi:flagellar P-ring protein precursor FlgI
LAAINQSLGEGSAQLRDPGSVEIKVSDSWKGRVVEMIATLEAIEATPDAPAQVIIDTRTGVIVVGEKVTLSPAAVAYGGLSVRIDETPEVSQPGPLSKGETKTVPKSDIAISEGNAPLHAMPSATTIADVAAALNALGVTPRELISILQALDAAGALHAKLVLL